jgi:hypothetical protein
MTVRRIDCHRCRHYFITWDPRFPHGCRRMGFKSRMYPSDEVRQTMSGHECRLFHAPARSSEIARPLSARRTPGDEFLQ